MTCPPSCLTTGTCVSACAPTRDELIAEAELNDRCGECDQLLSKSRVDHGDSEHCLCRADRCDWCLEAGEEPWPA